MANWQHDPFTNYNANLLKQIGTEQYTTGRQTQQTGQDIIKSGLSQLNPVYDYFHRLMSGDTTEIAGSLAPEIDNVTQQFNQVRRMISDQPRGGGKTSIQASLPIEQIRALTNLVSGARRYGAEGAGGVASKMLGAGFEEAGLGLNQTGQGTGAAGNAANIGLSGRSQDLNMKLNSFFSQFKSALAQEAGKGIGEILI